MMNFNHIIVPIREFEENYCYANNAFKKLSYLQESVNRISDKTVGCCWGADVAIEGADQSRAEPWDPDSEGV